MVKKRGNDAYQHFLHFPQCFQKCFCSGLLTLYQATIIKLVQVESIYTSQNKCNLILKFFLGWVENFAEKKRK